MPNDAPRDILITGYPSYLARRLLSTIAHSEPSATFRLLVRPDYVDEADQYLDDVSFDRERAQILSGDVVAMDLGLSGREYLELIENVTDIYNIASFWFLGVDKDEIHEVNVTGARNVADAAYEMNKLRRLNHLSTAFVAGDRTGVIMEDELDEGQSFRNAYEETKYQSELIMREAMHHIPVSVYRPSIIIGDSDTGEIDKLAGPYYIMNAIVLMPANVPVLMPGKGDKPLNLVPIDWVCEAMHSISRRKDSAGRTFHLTDPNPLSARKVFEQVARHAGRPAPVGRFPYRLTRLVMRFPILEKLTRSPRQFMDDFNQLSIYNNINTLDALHGQHPCPPLTSYVDKIVAYIKASEAALDVEMPAPGELLG